MDKGNLWSRFQLCAAVRAKPKSRGWFTPLIPSDTAEARRYLLERYGAQLHPRIRKKLEAEQHWRSRRRCP